MTLWPLTIEILITFTLSSILLYRYGNWSSQNIITTLSVFIAWFFSFLVIFILPFDISNTAYRQCVFEYNQTIEKAAASAPYIKPSIIQNISEPVNNFTTDIAPVYPTTEICSKPWSYAPSKVLLTLWRIVYWTSQVLTWLILPMMQSYSMAGDFTVIGKLKSSFIENAIYYGSFALIFILLFIYVAVRNPLDWSSLKVICVTASNTWGLFLLVVLLGYGLVEIPRSCYNTSLRSQTLNYLYFKVAKLSAEKCEAEEKLEDSLDEIHHAFEAIITSNDALKPLIDIILKRCPLEWKNQLIEKYRNAPINRRYNTGTVYNEKSLIRMHKAINRAVQTHHRTYCQWDVLIRKIIEWEDVSRNESNPAKLYKPTFASKKPMNPFVAVIKETLYTPRVEWYWKCMIRSSFYRCLSYVLIAFTSMVIWSELTFSVKMPTMSLFALLYQEAKYNYNYFFIEIMSIVSIAYLCICAYYTVFKIRVFNYYYLSSHHQTDEYSLIFCGMLLCRLTPPLCLNFLGLIHLDSHITKEDNIQETAFTKTMGHMDVIPIISDGFNIYLPVIMCIFCLATFFHFGSRILHMMGIEQFIGDDEMICDLIREGQELVKREKNKIIRHEESEQNKSRWSSSNVRKTQVPVNTDISPSVSSGDRIVNRSPDEDNSRLELLNNVEPIDYSNWRNNHSNVTPGQGIFDDI